jgi:hypothetical protein
LRELAAHRRTSTRAAYSVQTQTGVCTGMSPGSLARTQLEDTNLKSRAAFSSHQRSGVGPGCHSTTTSVRRQVLIEIRFIKFRLISSTSSTRVYQSKLSPLEDHCPSLDSATSATLPQGARSVRPPRVVPCLQCPAGGRRRARGPGPDTPLAAPSRLQVRAPVGGSDFSCRFRRFLTRMVTWALRLIPIVAISVRILFTSWTSARMRIRAEKKP